MILSNDRATRCTDFNTLPFAEKQSILCALIRGAADQWGEECMPAADIGDNRLFCMEQICDWVDSIAADPFAKENL